MRKQLAWNRFPEIPHASQLLHRSRYERATMGRMIGKWLEKSWDNTYWVIQEMDVTQWGIVSVLFVVTGFMCLRSRL